MKIKQILDVSTVIQRRAGIIFTGINNSDTVMMDIHNGRYFGIYDIAREIWELIEKPATIGAICGVLEDRYDITHEACLEDVINFTNDMLVHKLIEIG